MPFKKSEPCSSLWASCDELRGGMDASQYKACVLVLLFVKYFSDMYAAFQQFMPGADVGIDLSKEYAAAAGR